tara:strand:- start:14670 stop:15287 length:618 start_codon:yes stop_codon:yes gene_type:complete
MKGFKQCIKAHFYKDSLSECPYCPTGASSADATKTEVIGNSNTYDKVSSEKTQIFGGGSPSSSSAPDSTPLSSANSVDTTKTIIGGNHTSQENSVNGQQEFSRRKLRAWLVSFDIEDFGVDFRIIEGRNTIGSSANNDITIRDGQISGTHALILCKKDKFILTDELSSNGTLLNDEDLTPRETYEIKDGDKIKLGSINLLFKTAF